MTQAAAACTAWAFQGCPAGLAGHAGQAESPTLLKAVSTRGIALPSRSRSSASFLNSSCRAQVLVQCRGKHHKHYLSEVSGEGSNNARIVRALEQWSLYLDVASMLHELCDRSCSLSAEKHDMRRVLLVVLHTLIGMPPALCSQRRPWSRAAMAHCMATDKLVSALPECLRRPAQI